MNFKNLLLACVVALCTPAGVRAEYVPSAEELQSRKEFSADRFGIFIHWGFYSMYGQGEWFLHSSGLNEAEYAKAARGFYPADFNAQEWADIIRDAGARYVTFTSRHHDGFSMFGTRQSDYNIVDGTPFGRDVVKELAQACAAKGIKLHLYYSHLDWHRDDYPIGGTGRKTGRDFSKGNWDSYYNFMNNQLTELLTDYGPIRAIWFDGKWDHARDSIPFDWSLPEQYAMIHKLQPGCLIANNHHEETIDGEGIQTFERDVPGENSAGYSSMGIGQLPLETCQTMNRSWGYNVNDTTYKSVPELIGLLVKCAGRGANLLLNVGPQPNGQIPEAARTRLHEMGQWLAANGETIYGTQAGDVAPQEWGASTRKGNKLYLHILKSDTKEISITLPRKVREIVAFADRTPVKYTTSKDGSIVIPVSHPGSPDYILEVTTR